MNGVRKAAVRAAYEKLDVNKDGRVTVEDVAATFDVSSHPDVYNKRKSPEDIYREFLAQWDTQKKDGIVTF